MANRTPGTQDAVQRVRGEVQVGSARTRVPTRSEPDVRADSALELASEGPGAAQAEGAADEAGGAAEGAARAMLSSPV